MSIFSGIARNLRDSFDRDHDGAVTDNYLEAMGRIGPTMGGIAGGAAVGVFGGNLATVLAGAGAGGTIANRASDPMGDYANGFGDEIADLIGERDMSAPNAAGHGQGTGGELRSAIAPGTLGNLGGRLGAAAGTLGGPVMMAEGALAGTLLGTGLDRAPGAARYVADQASGLFSHFSD